MCRQFYETFFGRTEKINEIFEADGMPSRHNERDSDHPDDFVKVFNFMGREEIMKLLGVNKFQFSDFARSSYRA